MRVSFTVAVCDGPPNGISVGGGVGVPVGVETSHKNENKYIPISNAILDVLVSFLQSCQGKLSKIFFGVFLLIFFIGVSYGHHLFTDAKT